VLAGYLQQLTLVEVLRMQVAPYLGEPEPMRTHQQSSFGFGSSNMGPGPPQQHNRGRSLAAPPPRPWSSRRSRQVRSCHMAVSARLPTAAAAVLYTCGRQAAALLRRQPLGRLLPSAAVPRAAPLVGLRALLSDVPLAAAPATQDVSSLSTVPVVSPVSPFDLKVSLRFLQPLYQSDILGL